MGFIQIPVEPSNEEAWIAKYRAALSVPISQDQSRYARIRHSVLRTCKQFLAQVFKGACGVVGASRGPVKTLAPALVAHSSGARDIAIRESSPLAE